MPRPAQALCKFGSHRNNGVMVVRLENVSFDSTTPAATARFWADALGWSLIREDDPDEVSVLPPGEGASTLPELLFIRVPETKSVKNRLHLDFRPDDQAAEVAHLEALGATRVDVGQGPEVTWVVMADPEGNEFCVLRARQQA